MATVTRERDEQEAFDEQMRLLRKAARHSEYRGDDDAAEACRWAESRMRHERAAALASPPAEDEHALPTKADAWSLHAYVVDHAADHDDDCPGDDTCDCQFRARNEAVSRCVRWLIERPRAPQAPPASDPKDATHEYCPKCLMSGRLGAMTALRKDNGERYCLGCVERLQPLYPAAQAPPGLYRQGQEDMRRRVLDIVRDPSDCRIVKKLPIWGVPGMSEAAAAVAPLVERAQQATGGSDASDFRMRQSDPPKTEDEAFDWMVADAARRLGSPAPPASDPPGLVGVVAEFQRAHADYQRAKHEDVGQEFAWAARKAARDAVLAYPLPASPQAETKGDE